MREVQAARLEEMIIHDVFMCVCVKDSDTVIDSEKVFVCSKLALGLQGQMHF